MQYIMASYACGIKSSHFDRCTFSIIKVSQYQNPFIMQKKNSVKPYKSCEKSHSKIPVDETKILMTNGSLVKVESIAECASWSILQYF